MAELTWFNEIDTFASDWLANLFPGSVIDRRSIADVKAHDVEGEGRRHFFAGIGGWELALELAGWPRDRSVWTGSCPCQPFSRAGRTEGTKDTRHLWPDFFRLIRECRPDTIFGEQVSSVLGRNWLDGVCRDLEGEGYACGVVVLGAHSVAAPHIRQRIYWAANRLGNAASLRCARGDGTCQQAEGARPRGSLGGLGDTGVPRLTVSKQRELSGAGQEPEGRAVEQPSGSSWSDFWVANCRDGKQRRIGTGVQPVAHGIPRSVGPELAGVRRLAKDARRNRVGRLKGYGNAIVPQVAAVFVRAFMDEIELVSGFAVCPNCSHTWVATVQAGESPECPKCRGKGEITPCS